MSHVILTADMSKEMRSSATKAGSGGVDDSKAGMEDVNIEDFRPPEWRTVLNRRADLGEQAERIYSISQQYLIVFLLVSRLSGFLPFPTGLSPNRRRPDRRER